MKLRESIMVRNNNDGIIRITNQTPDREAFFALLRAFYAFVFARKENEFTEITFRNRNKQPIADSVIIINHRTPDPLVKLNNEFRHQWAQMIENQQIRVVIGVESKYEI